MNSNAPGPAFRIHDFLRRHIPIRSDHVALVEDGNAWTYGRLHAATENLANALRSRGLRAGDRLMIVGENSVAQVAALFAASMLDAWAVLVNARMTAVEVAAIEAHCQPRVTFFTSHDSPDAKAHAEARQAESSSVGGLFFACTGANALAACEPVHADSAEQVAVLIYTTGTTGNPKGVMLTHRNLGCSASASSAARHTHDGDDIYAALPMSHVFGLASVVLAGLAAGATVRLAARFDARHVVEALNSGITFFQGVPAMYVRLLALHDEGLRIAPSRLRFVHCGGAPLDAALKGRVETMLGKPINNGYGMTEASPSICMVPYNQRCDDLTVGFLVPGLEARICEVFLNDVVVPKSELVGIEGRGWDYAKFLLGHERAMIARVGRSRMLLDRAKAFAQAEAGDAKHRSGNLILQIRLAEIEARLRALEVTELRALDSYEPGKGFDGATASMLKIEGSEICQQLTEILLDLTGRYSKVYTGRYSQSPIGSSRAHGLMGDHLFNRVATIYGGSTEIQKNVIAKSLL